MSAVVAESRDVDYVGDHAALNRNIGDTILVERNKIDRTVAKPHVRAGIGAVAVQNQVLSVGRDRNIPDAAEYVVIWIRQRGVTVEVIVDRELNGGP